MLIEKKYQGTLPDNKIVNTMSDSQTDCYSCDYVNNLNTYSEEETVIGTWFGKPIYRKIVTATLPSVENSWTTIATNATTNIDRLIKISSTYYSETDQFPIPISEGNYFINLKMNKNDILCTRSGFSTYTCDFVIEYTKTTD